MEVHQNRMEATHLLDTELFESAKDALFTVCYRRRKGLATIEEFDQSLALTRSELTNLSRNLALAGVDASAKPGLLLRATP